MAQTVDDASKILHLPPSNLNHRWKWFVISRYHDWGNLVEKFQTIPSHHNYIIQSYVVYGKIEIGGYMVSDSDGMQG